MIWRRLVVFGSVLFLTAAAQAQTVAGSISGLVLDSSGAAVTEVAITVTDIERSVVAVLQMKPVFTW